VKTGSDSAAWQRLLEAAILAEYLFSVGRLQVRVGRLAVVRVLWCGIVAGIVFVGRATAEDFHYPLKPVAADGGPVYVADLKLPGILVVKDGHIEKFYQASTKFGTPLNRIRSLAIDRSGKLLAGDTATREIYRFDEPGKPTPLIKGANAGIGMPMGIAVDSKGTIFVTDLETGWIWKLAPAGGAAQKFAEVPAPTGMTIDGQDRLWVVSRSRDQLYRVSPDGKVEPVVHEHPFHFPNDVVLDPSGTAYISDGYGRSIWKLAPNGKPESWISGGTLINPGGLCWHDGKLLVADPNPAAAVGHVYQADSAGKLTPLAGK
jgi:DNA-binding beta-propeller fold protein YncE